MRVFERMGKRCVFVVTDVEFAIVHLCSMLMCQKIDVTSTGQNT
jgi:hypothetical protein